MFPKFAEQPYAQYDFRMLKGSNSELYIKANSLQRESQKHVFGSCRCFLFCILRPLFIFGTVLELNAFISSPERSSRRAIVLPPASALALALALASALASASTNLR